MVRSALVALTVAVALGVAGLSLQLGGGAPSITGQEATLEERVLQLEERLAAVEARLSELEGQTVSSSALLLLDVNGSAGADTENFTTQGPRLQLCWDVTGEITDGPVTFTLFGRPGIVRVSSRSLRSPGADCTYINVEPGEYYLNVNAGGNADLRWHVTIAEQ